MTRAEKQHPAILMDESEANASLL